MLTSTLTTKFQKGCITHLLSGLLSTELYCEMKTTLVSFNSKPISMNSYLVIVEPVQMFLFQIAFFQETHFGVYSDVEISFKI